jgi:hypothetical protein
MLLTQFLIVPTYHESLGMIVYSPDFQLLLKDSTGSNKLTPSGGYLSRARSGGQKILSRYRFQISNRPRDSPTAHDSGNGQEEEIALRRCGI